MENRWKIKAYCERENKNMKELKIIVVCENDADLEEVETEIYQAIDERQSTFFNPEDTSLTKIIEFKRENDTK